MKKVLLPLLMCLVLFLGAPAMTVSAAGEIDSVTVTITPPEDGSSGTGLSAVSLPSGAPYTLLGAKYYIEESGNPYTFAEGIDYQMWISLEATTGSFSANPTLTVNGGTLIPDESMAYEDDGAGGNKKVIINALITAVEAGSNSGGDDSNTDSNSGSSGGKGGDCTHRNRVWKVSREATETEDGEEIYVCEDCGQIEYRVPITAYTVFNRNAQLKIQKAAQGAVVEVTTDRWISFHKMVLQALADRPDVTLKVSFLTEEYKGDRVSFTIPAGTDVMQYVDDNGFCGFLYLGGAFGLTPEG